MYDLRGLRLPGMLPQEGYDGIPASLGGLNAVPQMGAPQGLPSPAPGSPQPELGQQPSWLPSLAPPQGVMSQPAQGAAPQSAPQNPPSWVSALAPSQGVMPQPAQGAPSGGQPSGLPSQAPRLPQPPTGQPDWVKALLPRDGVAQRPSWTPPGANQAPGTARRPMQNRWGSRFGSGRRGGMFGGLRERLY